MPAVQSGTEEFEMEAHAQLPPNRILHLSDLHFLDRHDHRQLRTYLYVFGSQGHDFFDRVVALANRLSHKGHEHHQFSTRNHGLGRKVHESFDRVSALDSDVLKGDRVIMNFINTPTVMTLKMLVDWFTDIKAALDPLARYETSNPVLYRTIREKQQRAVERRHKQKIRDNTETEDAALKAGIARRKAARQGEVPDMPPRRTDE
jgi:hypothetical protein